jgi:aldehyde:ferredoxin oxidoreductase
MDRILYINLQAQKFRLCEVKTTNYLLPVSIPLTSFIVEETSSSTTPNLDFIVIGVGILGGHAGVGLSVATISGISAQSNGIIEAKVEGKLAATLRSLDLDAIAIVGSSTALSGIHIYRESGVIGVNFKDATDLMGTSVWEATSKASCGEADSILAIGSSGESESKLASVVSDYGYPTQTGGVGAIFGRLRIKYLRISADEFVAPSAIVKQISDEYLDGIRAGNQLSGFHYHPPGFGMWGGFPPLVGYHAVENFAPRMLRMKVDAEGSEYKRFLKLPEDASCPGCPQNCLKDYRINEQKVPRHGGRLHQLAVTVFFNQWGDRNQERALEFNSYCHEIGVEHLYVGALMVQEDPDKSLPIPDLVNSVLDAVLDDTALTVKNMPIPPFDPRGSKGLGLAMALNPGGPRYDVIEHDIDFDPRLSWERHSIFGEEFGIPAGGLPLATMDDRRLPAISQVWQLWSAMDALGVCIYASPPTRDLRLSHIMAMIKSIANIDADRESIFFAGKLRLAFQRELNFFLGMTSEDDGLPSYFFDVPIDTPDPGSVDLAVESSSQSPTAAVSIASLGREEFEKARDYVYRELSWKTETALDLESQVWRDMVSLKMLFKKAMSDLIV